MTHRTHRSLSHAWQARFALLHKLGADSRSVYALIRSPEYRALGLRDKLRVSLNPWAFFFDWVYYLCKGMWLKGAFIIGATFSFYTLVTVLDALTGGHIPGVVFWLPTPIICTRIANHDYYRKVVHSEAIWPGLPAMFARPAGAAGFALAGVGLYCAVSFSPIGVFA
ncbi:hypothetical protein GCM10022228_05850 [Halomonas cibimaris]|uniref:DUF2628 domain-containing protein n=1 Tax=Halomonas cibimaris TaxID=657012 RepID=A0ABP7LAE9_9GAMM